MSQLYSCTAVTHILKLHWRFDAAANPRRYRQITIATVECPSKAAGPAAVHKNARVAMGASWSEPDAEEGVAADTADGCGADVTVTANEAAQIGSRLAEAAAAAGPAADSGDGRVGAPVLVELLMQRSFGQLGRCEPRSEHWMLCVLCVVCATEGGITWNRESAPCPWPQAPGCEHTELGGRVWVRGPGQPRKAGGPELPRAAAAPASVLVRRALGLGSAAIRRWREPALSSQPASRRPGCRHRPRPARVAARGVESRRGCRLGPR